MSAPPTLVRLTRRFFNQALLSAFGALGAPARAAAPLRTPVLDFAIAGGWYHGLGRVRDSIAPGDRLRLVAEPENPYDRYAVAVWRGDLKLGYVPRAANRPLARLLAEGARIEADVMRVIADSGKDRTPFAYTSYGEGDPVIRATRIEA